MLMVVLPSLLNRYKEYVQRYGTGKEGDRKVRGNKIFRTHILATWAKEIVTHPRLLRAVSAVLGSTNLLIWSSDLTVKPKRSTECFGWHQDEAYADLGPPPKLCTAWLALTHASPTNAPCAENDKINGLAIGASQSMGNNLFLLLLLT